MAESRVLQTAFLVLYVYVTLFQYIQRIFGPITSLIKVDMAINDQYLLITKENLMSYV